MAELESSLLFNQTINIQASQKLQRVLVPVSAATEQSDQHKLHSITFHNRNR